MPRGGFKPVQPDETLAAIVGDEPMSRGEVTKRIWAYIKEHRLQDGRDVVARSAEVTDERLLAVLDGNDRISMFALQRHVGAHVKPVEG